MLLNLPDVLPLLRDPVTGERIVDGPAGLATASGQPVGAAAGQPILVDFARSVINEAAVRASGGGSAIERVERRGLPRRLKRLLSPEKAATRRTVAAFADAVRTVAPSPRVLVVGGGTVGQGLQPLYDDPAIGLVSFDIYASPLTHFIGDAHAIPLADESVHGVVVQAVLEHVLEPQVVVAEIFRVLKPGGVVFAETPFLQHVHEGPYDFTRFTESGHRYLFRRFQRIASGSSGGPGVQFMWTVDHLVRGLTRSHAAGKAAKLAVFWAQYLDALIPEPFAADAASGVYFLGRKSDTVVTPREIIAHYAGAQRPQAVARPAPARPRRSAVGAHALAQERAPS